MSSTHEPINPPTPGNAATSVSPPSFYPSPEAEYTQILQNRQLFLDLLHKFHTSLGSKVKTPTIGGRPLDLHRLFVEVTCRGGMDQVTNDRKWKEVFLVFKCPPTITGASFVLKNHYQSLLYHFEQVYYFRKKAPSVLDSDSASTIVNGSTARNLYEDSAAIYHHHPASSMVEPGSLLNGTVEAKFEFGYSVTVEMGSEQWKGVIYHIPSESDMPNVSEQNNTVIRQSQNEFGDASGFEENGTGYRYFYADIQQKLQPLYGSEVEAMNKKICLVWSTLSENEKQVYHRKGEKGEIQEMQEV